MPFTGQTRRLFSVGRCVFAFACWLATSASAGWAADPVPEVVTDLASFWRADAREVLRPVRMEALVSYYDPESGHLWGEFEGKPGSILVPRRLSLRRGDRVRIEGKAITRRGIESDRATISTVARGVALTPVPADGSLWDAGTLRGRLVTFEGVFDREEIADDQRHLRANFVGDGFRVHFNLWSEQPRLLGFKPGDRARLTGVYNVNQDPLTQAIEIDIWATDYTDVVYVGPAESNPRFATPVVPIRDLPRLFSERRMSAHVVGKVVSYRPGQSIALRDGSGQVLVQTVQTVPLRIGDWVQAAGFPYTGSADWLLRYSLVRPAAPDAIPARTPAGSLERLAVIDQVLALSPKEAAQSQPVEIMALVTWSNPNSDIIFIRDTSGGIRASVPDDLRKSLGSDLRPGLTAKIIGATREGAFAPEIQVGSIEHLGTALQPVARSITLDQAMTGHEEAQRVAITGHVQRVQHDASWSRVLLSTRTGTFTARVERDPSLDELVGSIVSVQGICSAVANARRQLVGIELLALGKQDFRVEQAALTDPFSVSLSELSALRQFSAAGSVNHWVRVRGVVTHDVSGRYLFLQDDTEGVLLFSEQTETLTPGDLIEAVGLPGVEDGRVVLREAVFRKLGERTEPAIMTVARASEIDEDLDCRLVRVQGRLLSTSVEADHLNLAIQDGTFIFSALLPSAHPEWLDGAWMPGARLALTGVYDVIRDERRIERGFRIQLRSPQDVVVTEPASWWTPARALTITLSLVGFVALGFVWVEVLRRRVREQTALIRRQVEKEANLDARNRAMVANATDFIFTTDDAGKFTSFNPAGERMLGYTAAEATSLRLVDLIAPEDAEKRAQVRETLARVASEAAQLELRLLGKDGRRVWMEIVVCQVRDQGQAMGVLGVGRDIGQRKQIEEELKRARDAAEANTQAKSAFLANMSHEIRTPMNGVIGMSSLILDTPLSSEQREYAETIRHSAESLLTVLNDILDFSKIEAGKLRFIDEPFDFARVLEETMDLMRVRAADKGLELALFVPPEMPRTYVGDPGRLRQVLLNLVGNAVKFTDHGDVCVTAGLEAVEGGRATLRVDVQDTGVGISAEHAARLFQPFSQADVSTTRRFGGTGLGLAISKQIVELMNGEIGVESATGQGSRFWFRVRLPVSNAAPVVPAVPFQALQGVRVLAVDRHPMNQKIISAYAAHWGMRAEVAAEVPAAMSLLIQAADEGRPFALALIDAHLESGGGVALARKMREDLRLVGTKVVFLTTVDRRIEEDVIGDLRISGVLLKPIHLAEMAAAMCSAIAETPRPPRRSSTASAPPPNPAPATPRQDSPTGAASVLRVLVAEDNPVNQKLLLLQLKKLGHEAEVVANGDEAVQAVLARSYDVVLMDCQMPKMDGYEATERIRQHDRLRSLRIVAMTANAMQGDREKCLECGMDDYLTKPTRTEELQQALLRSGAASK